MSKKDNINPSYYQKCGIQLTDFIISQDMNWLEGNIVKYITRYKSKGKPLEDLNKAKWYLDKLIEQTTDNEKTAK